MYGCPGFSKASVRLQGRRRFPGQIWSKSRNVQLPISVPVFRALSFEERTLARRSCCVQVWDETFCLPSSFYLHCSKSSCGFPTLDSGCGNTWAEGWVSPGRAFTKQRVMGLTKPVGGWLVLQAAAQSGGSSGWWWILNLPCLTVSCILLCKWASLGGAELQTRAWLWAQKLVSGWQVWLQTGLCWSPNSWCHAILFFFFSCSVLIIFLLKAKSLHSVLAAFLWLPTLHFVHDKILLWKELR